MFLYFIALAKLFNFMVKLFFAHQTQFGNIFIQILIMLQ